MPASAAYWRTHVLWPALAFGLAFACIFEFDLDRSLAQAWFFDAATQRWLGGGAGAWWAHDLIHTGGRAFVRSFGAIALVTWIISLLSDRWRRWRPEAGFVLCAFVSSIVLVGGLKMITNIDCPWDLEGFGGHRPYVALLADRPDELPRARCFPGAHSSSGFALMCGYFVLRNRSRRQARWALAAGIVAGFVFSAGQEARGAHFLSHDLAAAAVVWFSQLALYQRWQSGLYRKRRASEYPAMPVSRQPMMFREKHSQIPAAKAPTRRGLSGEKSKS
jgi:membrane-associated PAP2 superfamily phosphatase